jgi:hypothetical protein
MGYRFPKMPGRTIGDDGIPAGRAASSTATPTHRTPRRPDSNCVVHRPGISLCAEWQWPRRNIGNHSGLSIRNPIQYGDPIDLMTRDGQFLRRRERQIFSMSIAIQALFGTCF